MVKVWRHVLAEHLVAASTGSGQRSSAVIARQTARKSIRSAALWGYVFGAYVAVSALGYAATYKTTAERERFASTFSSNAALDALIGRAHRIETVAGFTAWRSLGVLTIVGAIWGLLTATKLLRGEEDAGRWEVLLAGRCTRGGAARQAWGGLAVGVAMLWSLTAVITVVVGRSSNVHLAPGPAMYLALALVASAGLFVSVGVLTSQLAATRRQASAYGAVALGAFFALRMVADSGTGLDWLRWTTPLGWIEALEPLASPRPIALVPIVGLTVVLGALGVRLAGSRDLGASTLPDRSTARPRTRLLGSPAGLALRLMRPTLVGWGAAVAGGALLMGFVAKQAGRTLEGNTSVQRVLSRLGTPGLDAKTYLGVAFLIVSLFTALAVASLLSTTRAEEAEGRLDHILVRSVSRPSWLGGRWASASLVAILLALCAGVSAWLGVVSQHAGVGLPTLLEAGLNSAPPALCVVGVGTGVFGFWPRATTVSVYALIAWSFLVEIIGGAISLNHWVLDTSVFHQMAAAPAVDPNWTAGATMAALAIVAAMLGVLAFQRRDLVGE
jgi:ABC-2 type transport system permease protein